MNARATANDNDAPNCARRIRILLNPNSGAKGGIPTNRATEEEIRAVLARHGLDDELVVTASEDAAIAATREAVEQHYDAVVAAGGDGTVGTVACQLLGTQTALGLLPLGSVMNVARMLGIPRELDAAAEIIAGASARAIDVGEAKGQIFLEGGSAGLNAAVFREAQQADGEGGRVLALWATLRELVRYQPPRMVIQLDDRILTTRALAISIANGPYAGLGFTVSPGALLDDGLFDVVIFSRFTRAELVRHFGTIAFGRHPGTTRATTYRSARVRVEGVHPLPCRVDAHDLGTTPVEFVVRPRALRVIAPEPVS